MKSLRLIVLGLVLAFLFAAQSLAAGPAILFAYYNFPGMDVDTQYRHELQDLGYEVGRCNYADISWNLLRQFNILVMDFAPPVSYTSQYNTYLSKLPLINQFLSNGGGVFLLYEHGYDQNYQAPNEFLSPYGASIVNEGVVDPTHGYKQVGYLGWHWARTSNIVSHAVTSGVSNIWYPVGSHPTNDRMTATMTVDSNWQVVARGESTAYSFNNETQQKTYTSAPPIVAARSAGPGRIVVFPSYSTYTTVDGHHPALQDITWSRGDGVNPSHVYQMFLNSFNWLSTPSLGGGLLGGYIAPADPPDPPLTCPGVSTGGKVYGSPCKVLAGVHSAYSDGTDSVTNWANSAKAAGYSIVIFAENLEQMNATKWNQLVADCAAVSNSTFKAVAGIDYRDTSQGLGQDGERRIVFDMQQWFNPSWLTADGKRVTSESGVLFGNNWPGMILTNPKTNALWPWYAKFYRAFSIHTYLHTDPDESAFDDWLQLARDDYEQTPFVVRRLYSPAEIANHRGKDLYSTGQSIDAAYGNLKPSATRWACYVSDGPRIVDWYIDNNWWAPTDCGGTEGNRWTLHINVNSGVSLSEVIIYDGPNIFRRFKLSGSSFSATLTGMHDKQHDFVLVARDVNGKEAVGAALDTNSREHAIYMCADMQNNLNYAQTPNADNTKLNGFNPLGFYVTGWDGGATGVLINNEDLVPKGFDNAVGGFNFSTSHHLTTTSGLEWSLTRHIFYHGSRDCCILENPYRGYLAPGSVLVADTEYADTVARFVSFTPGYNGINIMRVDLTTTFKKTCPLGTTTGFEANLFRVGFPADSFPNYAYTLADGSKVTGVRNPNEVPVGLAPLQQKGYVAVYPDFYGSCAVFGLGRGLFFRLENGSITLGYEKSGQTIPSGTVWKNSVLLVRDTFGSSDLSNFDNIRSYFGASGTPEFAPSMITGSIKADSFFPLELQASNGQAMLSTSAADFANDVPVMVHGLNGRCDAGIYDIGSQQLKPIGITEGVGYTRFSTATARNTWIGNLGVADNPGVWVQLVDLDWQNPRWRLHNPTDLPVTTRVTALLPPLSGSEGTFTIPAGSTIEVTLQFVDYTPPTVPVVTDEGDTTTNHRSLSASWTSSDPESGISDYAVAAGTTPSDTAEYVVPWASVGTSTSGMVTGTFQTGKTYYIYVKATNGAGLASVAASNGIRVESSISQARSQPDRTSVGLDNVVITAAFPSIQRYYVEEYDRSAAIAFTNSGTFSMADEVSVTGEIRTVGGERMIIADPVGMTSTGNPLPAPFFANNRDLGGAAVGYEPGVYLGVGPSNLAYLFRTCGLVSEVGTGYFMLDDGSGVPAAEGKTGIKVIHGFGNPNPGAFVCVTGVSCVDRVNGVSYRALRTRSASDVLSLH